MLETQCLLETGKETNKHMRTLTSREYSLVLWIRSSKRPPFTACCTRAAQFFHIYLFLCQEAASFGLCLIKDAALIASLAVRIRALLVQLVPYLDILQTHHVLQELSFTMNNLLTPAASMQKSPISILRIFEGSHSMRCQEHT